MVVTANLGAEISGSSLLEEGGRVSASSNRGRLAPNSTEREAPEHAALALVEAVLGVRDAPEARVLPAPRTEFVEERDGVAALDCREQRAVGGRQVLVAVAARACVDDAVGVVFREAVGVAGVDSTEVREQRDETTAALVDTVTDAVRSADLGPRDDFVARGFRRATGFVRTTVPSLASLGRHPSESLKRRRVRRARAGARSEGARTSGGETEARHDSFTRTNAA
jgi:hypothetical protein